MYVVGFLAGWWLARRRAAAAGSTWKPVDVDDLIFFAAVGVIAGGRIGWMLFYGFGRPRRGSAVAYPGLGGRHVLPRRPGRRDDRTGRCSRAAVGAGSRTCFDFTAPLPALGLFAGRIGNFINGELWGKPTDLPWGIPG